jgi:hypothetical protein
MKITAQISDSSFQGKVITLALSDCKYEERNFVYVSKAVPQFAMEEQKGRGGIAHTHS